MQDTSIVHASGYQQPQIIESFEELDVLGDGTGIATALVTGSGIAVNEI